MQQELLVRASHLAMFHTLRYLHLDMCFTPLTYDSDCVSHLSHDFKPLTRFTPLTRFRLLTLFRLLTIFTLCISHLLHCSHYMFQTCDSDFVLNSLCLAPAQRIHTTCLYLYIYVLCYHSFVYMSIRVSITYLSWTLHVTVDLYTCIS